MAVISHLIADPEDECRVANVQDCAPGLPDAGNTRMYAEVMDFEITPRALKSLRDESQPVILIDVREPWEFQTAHVEGSLLMPMGDVPTRAHAELDPDTRIVAICHHGVRSLNVAVWLRNQGFDQAQSLSGGIDAWSTTVDPRIPRY